MIHLSAFADEIAADLDEQLKVLQVEGIRYIELRGVWDTNVLDLTDAQVAEIERRLRAEGMRVSAIGSPLGKVPVDVPLEREMERLEHAVSLARTFEAPYIRIFSYYPPSAVRDGASELYRDEVMAHLREMATRAGQAGITLLHENDTDLYGDTIERCVDVLQTVDSPSLQAVFDPANFVVSGVVPFPDAYDVIRPWVRHIHVKDAKPDRTVVPVGAGIARWPELLQRLRRDGYDGFLSLEPHLVAGGPYGGYSGPALFRRATQALKDMLHSMGWEYS